MQLRLSNTSALSTRGFRHAAAYILTLSLILVSLSSCQKVIDISVNDAAQKYVIEAELLSDTSLATVRITKTRNLKDDNTFEFGTGAVVTISDSLGNKVTLHENAPGYYNSQDLRGVSGRSYTLSISIDGQQFCSLSRIPRRVEFDSIQLDSTTFFGQKNYALIPALTDPPMERNYYRFILHYNDTLAKDIIVGDDSFADGLRNKRPIFTQVELKNGYRVALDMECIDAEMYNYWLALAMMQQGSGAQTPTNPPSNIKGGALGYFSAHTWQQRATKIP